MIRSLTVGLPIHPLSVGELREDATRLIEHARTELRQTGFPPRTVRYTLPPVGPEGEEEGVVHSTLAWVDQLAEATGVRWFCVPFDFVKSGRRQGRLDVALDIVERFPRSFLNLMVADESAMNVAAINDAAQLVSNISRKSNNGFDNFRVGVSCGCPPNAPFFPFSYHGDDSLSFSLALENCIIADRILGELDTAPDIDVFRERLVQALIPVLKKLNDIGLSISRETGAQYRGLDASFAPFPGEQISVAEIVERLLGAPVGSNGSVFITSMLTDALRSAIRQSGALGVGFNGVMFSLLEDKVLASANNRRKITLDRLMSLCTVCGCGVDMVPVPMSSFPEEIAAVMLDVAGISLSLKKPLGIRLLPIPNRSTNELTQFKLDFLCDSRIVGLSEQDRFLTASTDRLQLLEPR